MTDAVFNRQEMQRRELADAALLLIRILNLEGRLQKPRSWLVYRQLSQAALECYRTCAVRGFATQPDLEKLHALESEAQALESRPDSSGGHGDDRLGSVAR